MAHSGLEFVAAVRPSLSDTGNALKFELPAAARVGDLLIAVIVRNQTFAMPSGWSLLESSLGASGLFLDLLGRLVEHDEPATATFLTATPQPLQGQALLLRGGAPGVVRETSAHLAFTASSAPAAPGANSVQAINRLLAVYSVSGTVALTAPAGFTQLDLYTVSTIATRTLLVATRIAGATGLITPGPTAAAPAATGRAFSLVLRDRPPLVPPALLDPVPGNIGLLPL